MEVILEKGNTITITTNGEFMEKCSEKIVWVDYKNITKVKLERTSPTSKWFEFCLNVYLLQDG